MSDYALGATIHRLFSTAVGGVSTTLAGTPAVAAYGGASTAEITDGVTLSVDHDGRAGLNLLTIEATEGNGFAAGVDYALVVTQGTVGGTDVAGTVVAEFGLEHAVAVPVAAAVRAAIGLASADLDDQLASIKGDTAASRDYADDVVIRGTVSATSPTTTSFTASALAPGGVDADQFKGRVILFDTDTTTAALRGQGSLITANTGTALPLFTIDALTRAPVSGDTFSIV